MARHSVASCAIGCALLLLLSSGGVASDDTQVAKSEKMQTVGLKQVSTKWGGTTVSDLFNEYNNIFKHGNRNAASHLWSTFLLQRSSQMTPDRLEYFFSGFCAVSGSPVRGNDYNRYKLTLDLVDGSGKHTGYMHYCCWPCVCDTQDFIRVDTLTVPTSEGERKYHFAVIGNPCDHPEALNTPFVQPFYGRGETTIANEAREVRCEKGQLVGATYSDNGFPIISMFFDFKSADGTPITRNRSVNVTAADAQALVAEGQDPFGAAASSLGAPQPGRVRQVADKIIQDEYEWGPMCTDRARNGYNSGMGEIFRKVAGISSIQVGGQSKVAAIEPSSQPAVV